jgi:two-component system OmpR family response regulator
MQLIYMSARGADQWLIEGLRQMGHIVEVAGWGQETAALAAEDGYDLVLADMVRPDAELIARLSSEAPLAVLTDAAEGAERVAALKAGADCCLVRPLHLIEVQTQLMALVRLSDRLRPSPLRSAGLQLDRGARRLSIGAREAQLSAAEFRLVTFLLRREGEVVDLARLDRHLLGGLDEPQPQRIRALIAGLRSKLRRELGAPLVHAVRGHGYVLRLDTATLT